MNTPLAFRMRPTSLDEVIGQEHLVGPDGFLTSCVKAKTIVSSIFYGPPGSGKTTIAEAFAKSLGVHFIKINAVTSNKKEIENILEEARIFKPLLLIIDEIHRLNKDKQDLLLAALEDGTFYVIGATTANPYLSINQSIRSRCHLLEVKPLSTNDIIVGLRRAIDSPDGLSKSVDFSLEALSMIARLSGGDLRFGLNQLEYLALASKKPLIELDDISSLLKVANFTVDKDENSHYDSLSALQKSIRGSDVDAALYYMARLIVGGDLESIYRRVMVTAYEDIGLANPSAVSRAVQALESARQIGFPEASILLGFAVCDLALSPKSKASHDAIFAAIEEVSTRPMEIPSYLKLTPVNMKEEDKYPYERPDLWEKIQYLPDLIKDASFYIPNENGSYQQQINSNYKKLKQIVRSKNLASLKKIKK